MVFDWIDRWILYFESGLRTNITNTPWRRLRLETAREQHWSCSPSQFDLPGTAYHVGFFSLVCAQSEHCQVYLVRNQHTHLHHLHHHHRPLAILLHRSRSVRVVWVLYASQTGRPLNVVRLALRRRSVARQHRNQERFHRHRFERRRLAWNKDNPLRRFMGKINRCSVPQSWVCAVASLLTSSFCRQLINHWNTLQKCLFWQLKIGLCCCFLSYTRRNGREQTEAFMLTSTE